MAYLPGLRSRLENIVPKPLDRAQLADRLAPAAQPPMDTRSLLAVAEAMAKRPNIRLGAKLSPAAQRHQRSTRALENMELNVRSVKGIGKAALGAGDSVTFGALGHELGLPSSVKQTPEYKAGELYSMLLPGLGMAGGLRRAKQLRELVVGETIGDAFLHGTHARNLGTLAKGLPPAAPPKRAGKGLFGRVFPAEMNEFGAPVYLAEHSAPGKAIMFSGGKGETLAVVTLKPKTKVLDLVGDAERAPMVTLGNEPRGIHFRKRPAFTDDFIAWRKGRISDRFKQRNPDWEQWVERTGDPASKGFDINSWLNNLVTYARDRGYGAVRFPDEVLVTDRAVIANARRATAKERAAAQAINAQRRR